MNNYLEDESVIVHPLLFITQQGRGKTTILRTWYIIVTFDQIVIVHFFKRVDQLLELNQVAVIYHFVKFVGSTSSDIYAVYRRFVLKVLL